MMTDINALLDAYRNVILSCNELGLFQSSSVGLQREWKRKELAAREAIVKACEEKEKADDSRRTEPED